MSAPAFDIANVLVQLYDQQFVSLDGLNSGVPTRTTATLTPTTLRTIEETVLHLQNDLSSHGREAGFVPPLVEPSQPIPAQTQNNSNLQQQQQQQQQLESILSESNRPNIQTQLIGSESHSPIVQHSQPQGRKNMGGRRPARTVGMSPEEEERRKVRRERNKMAAARCRQRRMDHTNSLLEETEGLEQKKHSLQEEITNLQNVKLELETLLEEHKFVCRMSSSSPPDVKPIIKPEIDLSEERNQNSSSNSSTTSNSSNLSTGSSTSSSNGSCDKRDPPLMSFRPSRPSSLPVGNAVNFNNNNPNSNNHNRPNSLMLFNCEPKDQYKTVETPAFMKSVPEVAGVPITTPSNGIPFNFDSLMEGGTGLTPVSTPLAPSCSTQQRNNLTSAVDLSSPETNPPKLVSL